MPPTPNTRPTNQPTPPRPLHLARWLFIASAALGLVRFVVQLSDREMLIDQLRLQQPTLGQDELDAAATGGTFFGLLLAAALLLVYVLLANRMAQGRNWARVLLTALAAAGILVGVLRLITVGSGLAAAFGLSVSPVDLAFGVVTMVIDAVAVVLAFHPAAAAHFRNAPTPPRPTGGS
ncbi:hypothetical protein [Saccharothrix syringae]|uniref:Uncharacterized protein n=1 Tax=Saccharothrix syringae TaxID=103733 RepID=A0A5Q0HCF3_SACSY|nr:hypothetical protein [Saccharothrix syringae]QFZ23583.1 hypothetical protein EKG83_44605 [Saccharothrix syringae]